HPARVVCHYPDHLSLSTSVEEDSAVRIMRAKMLPDIQEAKVRKAIQAVQIGYGKFEDRSPVGVNVRENRRVDIAAVVVLEPEVLILDEPTAGLDLQSRTALFDLLHPMNREQGITIIWVSHQLEEILEHAARMIALKAGQFVADGAPSVLLSDPALLQAFDWEAPPALAVPRIFLELGAAVQDNRPLTALEAAGAILALHQNRQVSI
ncbi:ABC transporter, partial [Paenibacillus riograndensis]